MLIILYTQNMIKHSTFKTILYSVLLISIAECRCSFRVLQNGQPLKVDEEPHLVTMQTQCTQYNGKYGCCNQNNDNAQITSYTEIDGIFGSLGDGCDICAINLKRFWCQYACSPRQSEFLQVSQGFEPVPDPQKPDQQIMVQKVKLTIQAQTACDLYNSCNRISFVTSVSAMSTPAGFLTFQGHNAVDDAFQFIDTQFSYGLNDSLYFNDKNKTTEPERAALTLCNHTQQAGQVHGFNFMKNCSCNNCEYSCKSDSGFIYYESGVFEGFDGYLVLGVWVGVILIAAGVTIYRNKSIKLKDS